MFRSWTVILLFIASMIFYHPPARAVSCKEVTSFVVLSSLLMACNHIRIMESGFLLAALEKAQTNLASQSTTTLSNHFGLEQKERDLFYSNSAAIIGMSATAIGTTTGIVLSALHTFWPQQSLEVPYTVFTVAALVDVVAHAIGIHTLTKLCDPNTPCWDPSGECVTQGNCEGFGSSSVTIMWSIMTGLGLPTAFSTLIFIIKAPWNRS